MSEERTGTVETSFGEQSEQAAMRTTRPGRVLLVVVALGFLGMGLLDGVGGALWADVLRAFHVSNGLFGVASAAGLAMSFPVMIMSGALADRFDKRSLLLAAFGLLAASSLGIIVGTGLALLILLLMVRGLAVSLLDLGCNALAMDYERINKRHVLSPLHGVYSGGTMVSGLVVYAVVGLGGGFRISYALLAAVYVVSAAATRLPRPMPVSHDVKITSPPLALGLFRSSVVRILALICAFSFFGETLVSQWAALYLRDQRGFSARVAALALGAYGGAMLAGRLATGPLAARVSPRTLLLLAGATTAVGGALVWAHAPAAVSVVGCGICGLGFASMVPLALSLGSVAISGGTGATSGALLGAGYAALVVGPLLAGALSATLSLRAVVAMIPLFGTGVFLLASRLRKGAPGSHMRRA